MAEPLSILIVTYRDRHNLGNCLEAIYRTAGSLHPRIFVFDNDSNDGTVEMMRERFPGCDLLESTQNVGWSKAMKICFERVETDYFLALDSDAIVQEGTIADLLDFMSRNPDFGAVGPRMFYPDGSIQQTARGFPTAVNALFGRRTLLTRLFPGNPWVKPYLMSEQEDSTSWFEADWVSAACMMMNRRAVVTAGGFDEDFFVYWSDTDLCFRLRKAGFRIACFPKVEVIHYERNLPGQKKSNRMIIDFHRGVYLFYKKNYTRSRIHPMLLVVRAGLGLRVALHLGLNALKQPAVKKAPAIDLIERSK